MHEMGLALEIYRVCRQTADANGGGRLERALLAVGELAAVEPDLLRFAWEAVLADTGDIGAQLEIDFRRACQRCPWCDEPKERTEGGWLRLCPDCGRPLDVSGGDELDILELSFTPYEAGEVSGAGSDDSDPAVASASPDRSGDGAGGRGADHEP
jgi:hydrogenase nickel incorporation protein HypA/HybF